MLIDQLTGPFDSGEHRDEYRWELERVIEAKLSGVQLATTAPAPVKGKVVDLMAALKASIDATKSESASPKKAESAPEPRAKATVG